MEMVELRSISTYRTYPTPISGYYLDSQSVNEE